MMHPEDRAEWSRQQAEAAPDYRQLGDRTSIRRGPEIPCDICRSPIRPGDKYRTLSHLVDGEFQAMRMHVAPLCPPDEVEREMARQQFDREAEEAAQLEERDREARHGSRRGVRKPPATGSSYAGA